MPHELMGTSTRNSLDFEGEVDVLEYAVMSIAVKVLHQSERVLGVAVIADTCDFRNGFDGVRRCLYECYCH